MADYSWLDPWLTPEQRAAVGHDGCLAYQLGWRKSKRGDHPDQATALRRFQLADSMARGGSGPFTTPEQDQWFTKGWDDQAAGRPYGTAIPPQTT